MRSLVLIATLGVLSLAPSAASAQMVHDFSIPPTCPTACREKITACPVFASSAAMSSVGLRPPAPLPIAASIRALPLRSRRPIRRHRHHCRLRSTTGIIITGMIIRQIDRQIRGPWSNHRPLKFVHRQRQQRE